MSSVAQGGTTSGPTTPVLAVSPASLRPSTRQKMRGPVSGRGNVTVVAEPTTVSATSARNWLSRATRSRNVTGDGSAPCVHENTGVIVPSGLFTGLTATRPANDAAAPKSGRPQPNVESGAERFDAFARNSWRIAIGPRLGKRLLRSTMPAAVSGVANDVPASHSNVPGPESTQTATPGAVKSGFSRPSAVGPRLEKSAMLPSQSSAPIARSESASAGVHSVRNPGPLLLAAVTTVMPRFAAASTATVVTATPPFKSDGWKVNPLSNTRCARLDEAMSTPIESAHSSAAT